MLFDSLGSSEDARITIHTINSSNWEFAYSKLINRLQMLLEFTQHLIPDQQTLTEWINVDLYTPGGETIGILPVSFMVQTFKIIMRQRTSKITCKTTRDQVCCCIS
jgi:hypothetical protein